MATWSAFLLTAGMAAVIFLLVLMHRRSQEANRTKLEEYYKEQTG